MGKEQTGHAMAGRLDSMDSAEIRRTIVELGARLKIDLPDSELPELVDALPWSIRLQLKEAATERLMEVGFDSDWRPNEIGVLLEQAIDVLGVED